MSIVHKLPSSVSNLARAVSDSLLRCQQMENNKILRHKQRQRDYRMHREIKGHVSLVKGDYYAPVLFLGWFILVDCW